jgi:hypothetical protein
MRFGNGSDLTFGKILVPLGFDIFQNGQRDTLRLFRSIMVLFDMNGGIGEGEVQSDGHFIRAYYSGIVPSLITALALYMLSHAAA